MPVARKYSAADRRQALRLYRKGWGYGRIAEVIGCFPSTIKKWVEAAGVPKHPGPKRDQSTRNKAIDVYQGGNVTIVAAAEKAGVHPRTLSRWLLEDGVEIRGRRCGNREDILRDIRTGMKKKDIAAKYKCSESWIYRIQSGE